MFLVLKISKNKNSTIIKYNRGGIAVKIYSNMTSKQHGLNMKLSLSNNLYYFGKIYNISLSAFFRYFINDFYNSFLNKLLNILNIP